MSTQVRAGIVVQKVSIDYLQIEIWRQGHIRVLKGLFLVFSSCHADVPLNLYMNRLIVYVPWQGWQVYKLLWETLILPIALEKRFPCHSIVNTNIRYIHMLKMSLILINQMYPDGPKDVVNLGAIPCFSNLAHQKKVRVAQSSASFETSHCNFHYSLTWVCLWLMHNFLLEIATINWEMMNLLMNKLAELRLMMRSSRDRKTKMDYGRCMSWLHPQW